MSPSSPRRGWLLIVLVLLFPLGASASIACCAGALDRHGLSDGGPSHCAVESGSCCDRAPSDPVARHCCQGGDVFERPHSGPAPALAVALSPLDVPPAPALTDAGEHGSSARHPVPRSESLYTLHSSLLI